MDFRTIRCVLHLLTISSLLCSLSRAESSGSVFFVDDQCRRYIRSPSQDDVAQVHSSLLLQLVRSYSNSACPPIEIAPIFFLVFF
uniref:Uncharacterized protein MANES_03G149000 n=1 Tax=Rhizophora mucronata TaxID=61149 RepID=A0A2P2LDF7_RHIMU